MMEATKIQLEKFKTLIDRLNEVLARDIESDDIVLDATIQRFEFVFENCWKTIKHKLKDQGLDCISPRECIKTAFRNGWITDEKIFLDLLECRNQTSHTYNFDVAVSVYDTVKANAFVFYQLHEVLKNDSGD